MVGPTVRIVRILYIHASVFVCRAVYISNIICIAVSCLYYYIHTDGVCCCYPVFISAWFQKRLLLSSRDARKYNSMITASFAEETVEETLKESAGAEGTP